VTTGSVYITHKTLLSRTPEAIAMTAISVANGEKTVSCRIPFYERINKDVIFCRHLPTNFTKIPHEAQIK
jgi:hypothetical protein